MATQRKNETREEYLERTRIISKNRRDNYTPKQLERARESARLRSTDRRAEFTPEDRRKESEYERARRNKHFIVYTHTLGDKMYIGSGNRARPIDFIHRRNNWFNAFNTFPDVEIVSKIKTKELSLLLESMLIRLHGLDNLVNQNRPKSVKEFILNKYSV